MESAFALLVVATMGVSFGWEPVGEDPAGYEYVVQLEPELLDVLRSGESVPIESYVPADVTPIRKVRIVVGRDAMPRSPAGDASDANELIVRGQDATSSQSYTARRTDAEGRPTELFSNTTAPPWPATSSATTTAPPWPQSTNDTVRTTTTSGQHTQGEPPMRQASNGWTSIRPSVPPPPLLTPPLKESARAVTTTGSSTQQSNELLQAPPIEDRYQTSAAGSEWGRAAAAAEVRTGTSGGPSLLDPAPSASAGLVDASRGLQQGLSPVSSSATAQNSGTGSEWASSWDTAATSAPATIRREAGDSTVDREAEESKLVPVPPSATVDRTPAQPSERDRYTNPQTAGTTQPRAESPPAVDWSWPAASSAERPDDSRTATSAPASDVAWPSESNPSPPVAQTPPTGSPVVDNRRPVAETSRQSVQPEARSVESETRQLASRSSSPNPQPWLPLILVSLGLAGSLGANLFLGWSYMDARQRYQSLVRKTTGAFHRATGAAA